MLYPKKAPELAKKKLKKLLVRDKLVFTKKYPNTYKDINLLLSNQWSFVMLRANTGHIYTVYLYSPKYFFRFAAAIDMSSIIVCPNTNVISIGNYKLSTLSYMWATNANLLLASLSSFLFKKIRFKGKGYYLYKNLRNTVAPQFGYYHRIYIYSFFNKVKFLSKTKLLVFGFIKQDVAYMAHNLKSKRRINIFTGRGVRFARQVIYKKTGKVSSYR